MKKHVVLVNPSFVMEAEDNLRTRNYNDFPLGLALLGSVLVSAGFTVDLHNANVHADWRERTLVSLARPDLAYVGFSCMSSQVQSAIELCKKIREISGDTLIVFGGVHPTLVPESLVRTPWVDISVVGEGDAVVSKLVDYANGIIPLADVPNLVAVGGAGEIIRTERAALTPFEKFPDGIHESLYLEDMGDYVGQLVSEGRSLRQFAILTGLGCNYKCSFCINNITNRRYRSRSAESIYAEMKFLREHHSVDYFVFQDEHFFSDKLRFRNLLDFMERDPSFKNEIRWTTTVRVSDIRADYLTVAVLRRLVESGCLGLGTGGESGSDRVLRELRKGTRKEDIVRAAAFCNEAGLTLSFSFVMLWPGETILDMFESAKVIDEIHRMGPYGHVPYFQTYRPYPGSIWEPDLSRFEDPENIPKDTWRFQFVERSRLAHLKEHELAYRLILVTQILCLVGGYERLSKNWMHRIIRKGLYSLCSFRIRKRNFRLFVEEPVLEFLQRKYMQF